MFSSTFKKIPRIVLTFNFQFLQWSPLDIFSEDILFLCTATLWVLSIFYVLNEVSRLVGNINIFLESNTHEQLNQEKSRTPLQSVPQSRNTTAPVKKKKKSKSEIKSRESVEGGFDSDCFWHSIQANSNS